MYFVKQLGLVLYDTLTQNKKIPLSYERIQQVIKNIQRQDETLITLPEQTEYSYDDLFRLKLEEHPFIMIKPLGQK